VATADGRHLTINRCEGREQAPMPVLDAANS
jgi:hypothetical protein